MRKTLSVMVVICVIILSLSVTVLAVDNGRSYNFSLTSNNSNEIHVTPGDIITVTLTLRRTTGSGPMYAMQDEINYDSEFFEFVVGSDMAYQDVAIADIALKGNVRAHYMNYLSLEGGTQWPDVVTVGTFQLKVIGSSGVSVITNQECKVSVEDGSDTYAYSTEDLRVIVSTDCTVRFESNGGSEVPDQIVQYGEQICKPDDPTREGYVFTEWYRDIGRTQPWDFEQDIVKGNMVLYAGWEKGNPVVQEDETNQNAFSWWIVLLGTIVVFLKFAILNRKVKVQFETGCSETVPSVHIKRGGRLAKPDDPIREGAVFLGWAKEPKGTILWDFERDAVEKKMTLYAVWE